MSDKKYTMHVLSHTHWDREWYQDFQGFRQRLVYQVDKMMDVLDSDPDYKYFLMDGQTIWLEDYLQIRPENRERITKHLRSGEVLMGPWLVMPDELLLSGESLVRNLILGHKICADFDVAPMSMGYVSDIFGHCSQFPQILKGFGIDTAFLHRGTTNDDGASEMVWEGADGTEVLFIKAYPWTGYNDFMAYREADENTLLEYEKKKNSYASTSVLFALDGNDHQAAHTGTPGCIKRINSIFKNTHVIHSNMVDYLTALKAELGSDWKSKLKRYKGELRYPMRGGQYAELFHGTASARVNLKQRNDELEWMLPRVTEPLHIWSYHLGGDSQKPFLDLAWKYLITNHPHDSIVGCSIDQVHRDMIYRFDQAKLLAKNSIGESVNAICDRLDTASLGESDLVVTVFNPSAVDAGPVVQFPFEIFADWFNQKDAEGLKPAIFDDAGNAVYFEIYRIDPDMWPDPQVKKYQGDFPRFTRIDNAHLPHFRFHVDAASSVPAMGYRTYVIKFVPKDYTATVPEAIYPVACDTSAGTIENEYLKLKIRKDGLADLVDKVTGVSYEGLHSFEDCGDTGQGWDHLYPENDTIIRSTDPGAIRDVEIKIEQCDKLRATASVSFSMRVPKSLSDDRKARSSEMIDLPITMKFTVKSGCKFVECETTVHNTARCHRLRAMFPTGLKTDVWYGDNAFDIVRRNIKLMDTTGWGEQAREETPIKNFMAVQDDKAGFAVMTKGVCEAAVQDNSERTVALTLFRGFEQQIGDGWTQDSNLLGDVTLHYALIPYAPNEDSYPVQLFSNVEQYKINRKTLTHRPQSGDLPVSSSFMEVSDGLVVSTVKMSEDGKSMIVRLFNPSDKGIEGSVKCMSSISNASLCDSLERELQVLDVMNGKISFAVKPKEIVTIKLS